MNILKIIKRVKGVIFIKIVKIGEKFFKNIVNMIKNVTIIFSNPQNSKKKSKNCKSRS